MNVKLLKQVRAAILKHPDQFEMGAYFAEALYFGPDEKKPGGCGTAACVAGWATFLANKKRTLADAYRAFTGGTPEDEAVRVLRLDKFEALRLFHLHHWPLTFANRYENAETPQQRARAGADRITHFIKTKGAA